MILSGLLQAQECCLPVAGSELTLGFTIDGTLAEILVEWGDSIEEDGGGSGVDITVSSD